MTQVFLPISGCLSKIKMTLQPHFPWLSDVNNSGRTSAFSKRGSKFFSLLILSTCSASLHGSSGIGRRLHISKRTSLYTFVSRDALDTDIFRFSGPLIFQSSAYNIYGSGCAICALLIKCARSEFLEVGRKDWNAILNSARDLFMFTCSFGISKNTIAARVKKFIYDYIRYRCSLRKLALFFLFPRNEQMLKWTLMFLGTWIVLVFVRGVVMIIFNYVQIINNYNSIIYKYQDKIICKGAIVALKFFCTYDEYMLIWGQIRYTYNHIEYVMYNFLYGHIHYAQPMLLVRMYGYKESYLSTCIRYCDKIIV